MLSRIIRPILLYLAALIIMAAGKIAFMQCLPDAFGSCSWADRWHVVLAGQLMDNTLAACITLIPALLTILSTIMISRVINRAMRIYYIPVALVMSAVWATDTTLYSFWGIKLDITPFFYFFSSPALAMASAPVWQVCLGLLAWLVIAALIWAFFSLAIKISPLSDPSRMRSRRPAAIAAFFVTLLLLIPIFTGLKALSGGLPPAPIPTDRRLNHAAVNPLSSLILSANNASSPFGSEMRFMAPAQADSIAAHLLAPAKYEWSGSTSLLSTPRPDIYLIILESFSNKLLPSLGGEDIAPGLDSIARDGLLFTRFFASSFRTDRALPAILSGIPAPPTQPLLMHIATATRLPAFPSEMRSAGYATAYYYGGDPTFANQLDYLRSAGFSAVISEDDFPAALRASKWGVRDADLFDRVAADIASSTSPSDAPRLTVIQTLSSHEPFDVDPSFRRHSDPAANAFAYTDSCLEAFIDSLAASPRWNETLVIITPDHYGCYPKGLSLTDRHRIPLVMTGGALTRRGIISTPASQNDIAATLLAALNLPADKFPFSRDILATPAPAIAFFSEPDFATGVGPDGSLTRISLTGSASSAPSDSAARAIEAYLTALYSYFSRLSSSSPAATK